MANDSSFECDNEGCEDDCWDRCELCGLCFCDDHLEPFQHKCASLEDDDEAEDNLDGECQDTHDGEGEDTHDGEGEDTHDGECQDTHDGECEDTLDGECEETHGGECEDTHGGECQETHDGECQDTHDGECEDTHGGEGEDTLDGECEDTHDCECEEDKNSKGKTPPFIFDRSLTVQEVTIGGHQRTIYESIIDCVDDPHPLCSRYEDLMSLKVSYFYCTPF